MYPCLLEYRSTRTLVLAATNRAEEALRLLEYPLYETASLPQKAQRELARAFALRQQNRLVEAEGAAARALRLEPSVTHHARALGLTPGSAARPASPSLSRTNVTQAPLTFEQEPLRGSNQLLARLIGIVLLFFGIGCGALVVFIIERNFESLLTMERGELIILTVLAAISAFCCTIGYRMALNRPNRHGSILPPFAWAALAAVFGALGVFMGAMVFVYTSNAGGGILGAMGSFAFARLCWKARTSAAAKVL
jgi:hypothetical protein